MRTNLLVIAFLALLFSCSDNRSIPENDNSSELGKGIPFFSDQHATFRKWNTYHVSRGSGFQNMDFLFLKPVKTAFTKGTIYGTFDQEFDETYRPFLVYNPNKEQYIDFNSYHWTLVNGEPQFEIDQEINWVDTKHKTVKRIAFCGSEEVVEDVYWKDDNTVVLLKMIGGNTPEITIIDLNQQTSTGYVSTRKSDSLSEYYKRRIRKGIKNHR